MLEKSSVDKARVLYYGLLSRFLIFKTNQHRFDGVDDMLAIISSNPLNDDVQNASKNLLNTIDSKGYIAFSQEYEKLFHDLKNRPLNSSVSFYDEGIEFGKKCVEVRDFLQQTTIRRDEKSFKDSEDNFGFLMIFMSEMIQKSLNGEKNYENLQKTFFSKILNPYIDNFLEDIFTHQSSKSYKDVTIIASAFMEFERLYFEVKKPKDTQRPKKEFGISNTEAKRRALNKAKKEADKKNRQNKQK